MFSFSYSGAILLLWFSPYCLCTTPGPRSILYLPRQLQIIPLSVVIMQELLRRSSQTKCWIMVVISLWCKKLSSWKAIREWSLSSAKSQMPSLQSCAHISNLGCSTITFPSEDNLTVSRIETAIHKLMLSIVWFYITSHIQAELQRAL